MSVLIYLMPRKYFGRPAYKTVPWDLYLKEIHNQVETVEAAILVDPSLPRVFHDLFAGSAGLAAAHAVIIAAVGDGLCARIFARPRWNCWRALSRSSAGSGMGMPGGMCHAS